MSTKEILEYKILSIAENHIESFREAVDCVAKELKFLARTEAPTREKANEFVMGNILGNWPHFIATHGEVVVGWCAISSLHSPAFEHSGGLGIGVIAPFRGLGIGESLIKAALKKAFEKGLVRIELSVREDNKAAITLYQKYGFEIEGFHRHAYFMKGKYLNLISMALIYRNNLKNQYF
jgi:ribosomal protein S18 acetylase RimI-like enzyme